MCGGGGLVVFLFTKNTSQMDTGKKCSNGDPALG